MCLIIDDAEDYGGETMEKCGHKNEGEWIRYMTGIMNNGGLGT